MPLLFALLSAAPVGFRGSVKKLPRQRPTLEVCVHAEERQEVATGASSHKGLGGPLGFRDTKKAMAT